MQQFSAPTQRKTRGNHKRDMTSALKQTTIAAAITAAMTLHAGGVFAQVVVIDGGQNLVITSADQPSPWHIGNQLYVGLVTNGVLQIENSGVVTNTHAVLGSVAGSNGTVTVAGAQSSWSSTQDLTVAYDGTAVLTIKEGATVSSVNGYLGGNVIRAQIGTGVGTATVTGAGSTWANTGNMTVGFDGTGTLNVEAGGTVNSVLGYVGLYGTGTATVTGANSIWTNSSSMNVGLAGTGTLNIENGGTVTSTAGIISQSNGSQGTVNVTGTDSKWIATNEIYVGYSAGGNATLTIDAGGTVITANTYMTPGADTTGTINLKGNSSARGVLSTGLVGTGGGAAAFNWDGGILQARGNQSNFLRNFTSADITIASGGAYLDTQAFNVGILGVGVLNGVGGLTKLGTGTLTIEGGNTYSGNTTVSAGTLTFGSYTQSSGQTLGIGATSDTAYGKLNVTGTAAFNANANLYVEVASSPVLSIGNELVDVITAGTLNANGFKVQDNSALFDFSAVQNGNAVKLVVVANSAAGIRDAVNASNVGYASGAAGVLDGQLNAGAGGDMGTVIDQLGRLSSNRDVARATAQTLPIISGNQAIQGTLSTFQNLIQQRNGGAGTTGLSSGDALSNKNGWGKVFGSRAEQDDRSGASGFKADTWGLALGGDAEVAPGARFGVAYGYAKTSVNGNTDLSGTAQRANIDSHIVSAYGSKDIGGNRTFSFQGDIGVNSNKSTRQIDFGGLNRTARADYRTYSAHVGAAIAQAIELSEKTTLTPALRADYTWLKSQSYNETGADALNLNVGSNKTDAFVIGADAYLQHRFSQTSRIDANFGVGYDTINEQGNIVAAYAGAPGQSFVTTGIDHSPWLVRGGIGYSMTAASGTEVSFRYDAESRSDFLNHTASVRAKWAF